MKRKSKHLKLMKNVIKHEWKRINFLPSLCEIGRGFDNWNVQLVNLTQLRE